MPGQDALPSLVAVYGDEPFLKQSVLSAIRRVADRDGAAAAVSWDASAMRWVDVSDELLTPSLFGNGNRVVILRDADPFVSEYRPQLEDYVAAPARSATLVLELKSWPGNTRLAKVVAKKGLAITCRVPERKSGNRMVPDQKRLLEWIGCYAQKAHGVQLTTRQVERIVELVGENLGLIDGELAKLALFADDGGELADELVTRVVGGWRIQSNWDLLDSISEGDAAAALAQLDRLIQSGEHALGLFGSLSWSLRRFAAAARVVEEQRSRGERPQLARALEAAGVKPYPRDRFEKMQKQLRQIGSQRAGRLYRSLLNADLKLKRSHAQAERARRVLEELVFELASALHPRRSA